MMVTPQYGMPGYGYPQPMPQNYYPNMAPQPPVQSQPQTPKNPFDDSGVQSLNQTTNTPTSQPQFPSDPQAQGLHSG